VREVKLAMSVGGGRTRKPATIEEKKTFLPYGALNRKETCEGVDRKRDFLKEL